MPLPIRRSTPQRPPTRVRPRTFQPPYDSGGIRPIVTVAIQKKRPTRAVPDANSGIGIIAATNPQVVQAPPFNSGGLTPFVAAGVRRKNLSRPSSRTQIAPPFNSGSIAPSVITGPRRKNLYRAPERLYAPPYNSGSLSPVNVVRGVVRKLREALRPRIVIPPTVNNQAPGTPPRVSMGVKRPPPQRGRSRLQIAAPYNAGGIQSTLTQGVRRPAAKNRSSRTLPAARYNSGGVPPAIAQGARRRLAPGKSSRLAAAAPYNSGGAPAAIVSGVRRRAPAGRPSRRVLAAAPLLPGVKPVVFVARQIPRYIRRGLSRLFPGLIPTSAPPARDIGLYLGDPLSGWTIAGPASGWSTYDLTSGWTIRPPENEEP